MSPNQVTLYSFCFRHHGGFSSFHRLLHYSSKFRIVDSTFPLLWHTGKWLQPRLETRWRRLNEWRLLPVFGRREKQCVHYLYPENTLFHGAHWKQNHGLVLSCHQPGSVLSEAKDCAFYAGFFRGLERADRVVLLASNFLNDYAAFCDAKRLCVIPHGVDIDFFHPADLPPEQPLVLTVGNWLRDYDLWAKAVLELGAEFPRSIFVVVALPEVVRKAQTKVDAELGDRVKFLHGLSDAQLLLLYQQATLMFLPLSDAGANNAVLEAMACGIPIVTSDLPATREYAGNAAIYFSGTDAVDCIHQVNWLLRDRAKAWELGRVGRLRAESVFAWPLIARQYAELYGQVLEIS